MSMVLSAGPAWLFTPATRPDRVLRVAGRADLVVIDCEDAVSAADRGVALDGLRALAGRLDPRSVVVRINSLGRGMVSEDLAAVREAGLTTVVVPKAEDPGAIAALAPMSVVALCETPFGVLAAQDLGAVANVVGLMWGSVDLVGALGGRLSPGGGVPDVLAFARWHLLFAARAAGVLAIDHVLPTVGGLSAVGADAREAADAGFDAKACIHPAQLDEIRRAFVPDSDAVTWAQSVLATDPTVGALELDGQFIDEAVRERARRLLTRVR